jgi:prevent-host-death family protein
MVMEQIPQPSLRTRRLGVAEAKSKLSEVLREASNGPTIIHSRGKDLAVVLSMDDYERLVAEQPQEAGGAAFLSRVEELKRRHGGGVSNFQPARLAFVPAEPFAAGRKRS